MLELGLGDRGNGVKKDKQVAVEWFKKSADLGTAEVSTGLAFVLKPPNSSRLNTGLYSELLVIRIKCFYWENSGRDKESNGRFLVQKERLLPVAPTAPCPKCFSKLSKLRGRSSGYRHFRWLAFFEAKTAQITLTLWNHRDTCLNNRVWNHRDTF
jgi:hypothetical protein